MAAGPWLLTDIGRTTLLNGGFDLDTDTFLLALLTSASNIAAGSTTWAGVTGEHANQSGSGYLTNGFSLGTLDLSGTTTVKVDDAADAVWTATGGPITAKWACIYKSGGNVLCYCLLSSPGGEDVTATTGNTFTVAFHTSGIFTLA